MILAILQARMSSTRLPGKVLLPLAGAPMILRQIERIRRAKRIDKLVVATSTDPSDDLLAQTVESAGVLITRGSLDNVLSRFADAVLEHGPADYIVRLTGDCPLADPGVIDAVIGRVVRAHADYGCNTLPRTYPKGLDVECMSLRTFIDTYSRTTQFPEEREHVTWGIHRLPQLYDHANLCQWRDEGHVRWTVDTPEDYAFVASVYDALYPTNPAFTSEDVRTFSMGANQISSMPHGGYPVASTAPHRQG